MKRQERGLAVVLQQGKRTKLIYADGSEEVCEEEGQAWRRLGTSRKDKGEVQKEDSGDEGEVLTPIEAVENLSAAKGELELIMDLVVKLEQQQEVSIHNIPDTRTHAGRLGSMAREAAVRCGARKWALNASAVTLREGLGALRERSRCENNFYMELAKLQGFWKVQQNPAIGSQSAFSLDLSLGRVAEQNNCPPSAGCRIDVFQDEHGKLRIHVPKESLEPGVDDSDQQQVDRMEMSTDSEIANEVDEANDEVRVEQGVESVNVPSDGENPGTSDDLFVENGMTVIVGGKAVHEYLLRKQKSIIWGLLRATLENQGALRHVGGHYNMVALKLLSQAESSSDLHIAAFKPYLLMRFLSHIYQTPMSPNIPSRINAEGMLIEVVSWAAHCLYSRRIVWDAVELQAITSGGLVLHWQSTWHPFLSALHIIAPGKFSGIMVVRGSHVELEGILLCGNGSNRHISVQVPQSKAGQLAKALVFGEDTSFLEANLRMLTEHG